MLKISTCLALLFALVTPLFSQPGVVAQRQKSFNLQPGKPAIDGYDPVAYFESKKAVEGKKDFSYTHEGVLYYFRNAANLEAFKQKPAQYEPQYGGWCAYAMGHDGTKVSVDPETYRILDGKLYLFYNSLFNNTMKTWLKSEPALKKAADANWPKYYKP